MIEQASRGIFAYMKDNDHKHTVSFNPNVDELYEAFKESVLTEALEGPKETQLPGEYLLAVDDKMFKSYWNSNSQGPRFICGNNTYQRILDRAKELKLTA